MCWVSETCITDSPLQLKGDQLCPYGVAWEEAETGSHGKMLSFYEKRREECWRGNDSKCLPWRCSKERDLWYWPESERKKTWSFSVLVRMFVLSSLLQDPERWPKVTQKGNDWLIWHNHRGRVCWPPEQIQGKEYLPGLSPLHLLLLSCWLISFSSAIKLPSPCGIHGSLDPYPYNFIQRKRAFYCHF